MFKHWRENFIVILIFLFGAAIISRLIYLQIIQKEFYQALAQGQHKIFQPLKGDRGEIFFRGGQILAANAKGKYIYIYLDEIDDKGKTAEALSKIINLEQAAVIEKMDSGSQMPIKISLSQEEEKKFKEIEGDLPGVYMRESVSREYPQKEMASQVVGFLGGEGRGQYGLEEYYNDLLEGDEEYKENNLFSENIENFAKGENLFLALDYNIQFKAEKLLAKAKEDLNIEGGQIIVMEPNSGKIMAMANFPNFDLNSYSQADDWKIFQNSTIQKFYEPGSVFKPITMAAALDQEKITPQTTYIDEGVLNIGGRTIYNYGQRTWGEKTMTEVLEKSINTGAVFAERQIGNKVFLDYVERFGFFSPTGIDLQGEVYSVNKELKKGYEANFATASYGQGIEITPLQLVRAYAAIANGGRLAKPYVVEKFLKDGRITETLPEISEERIISEKTASQLTAMLVSVIENGFSKKARIPGYYIAGKTGTAQMSWSSLGLGTSEEGYSEKTWQSFIGFGPAFGAKFVILVKLDNPAAKTAEYSAVPIFKDLAKYIINYLQIPPDYQE